MMSSWQLVDEGIGMRWLHGWLDGRGNHSKGGLESPDCHNTSLAELFESLNRTPELDIEITSIEYILLTVRDIWFRHATVCDI